MNNNLLLAFLQEFFQRLKKKSPTFFKIISGISAAVALLSGLPGLFQELHISLPSWAEIFQNRIVAICSTVAFFISKLTVDKEELKAPESTIPFTLKQDKK
jgi:hypothetical protein